MYSAISWVPRGVAKEKLPERVDESAENEDEKEVEMADDSDKSSQSTEADGEQQDEVDIGEVLANDLDTLSFYKRNDEDPYLKSDPDADKLFDEDEMDDLVIRPTDALIVATRSGEDVSTLEVHLFDDDPDASDGEERAYVPHTYVHHDLVLPTLPLCTAFTHLPVNDQYLNLVAVGMFTPGIEIWDVDRVNNLEPVVSLGGYDNSERVSGALSAAAAARGVSRPKKKKKPKLRLKEGSHNDAVMALSWNHVQHEYLASGSADTTVKVWDVESSHCACTLNHHSGKVQSVLFHPSSAELLLSGSFDKTVQLTDLRDSSAKANWSLDADVETCHWGSGPTENYIIVTTEAGKVSVFDVRKHSSDAQPVVKWKAHKGAASGCSVSQDVPGLMITGGVDKFIKVWDISYVSKGQVGELIYEKPGKAGALFALSLCPAAQDETSNASPFVIAYGGAKGSLHITDLASESMEIRDRFLKHCSAPARTAIEKRVVRGTKASTLRKRREASEMNDDIDSDGSDSEEWEEDEQEEEEQEEEQED